MEDKATLITETAWNLYRAFRTYAGPMKAMEDARAVVPARGTLYTEPWVNEDGTEDETATYETTSPPTHLWLAGIAHARAIVLAFNLDAPTTDEDFNRRGINILTECIAHEIETSTEATRGQCDEWYQRDSIRYSDRRNTPVIGGIVDDTPRSYMPHLYPYIRLNLYTFDSRADFMKHINTVLPDMYGRLNRQVRDATDDYMEASSKAWRDWSLYEKETPRKVTFIVKTKGRDALLGHLDQEQWLEWEKVKGEYTSLDMTDEIVLEWKREGRDIPSLLESSMSGPHEPPHYDKAVPPVNPASGLAKDEWEFYWYFCTLDADGRCHVCLPHASIGSQRVAAPTRQTRGWYLSQDTRRNLTDFHRHTEWWIASKLEDKSYRQIAKDEGIASHTTVSKAIRRMEEDFLLRDTGGAS